MRDTADGSDSRACEPESKGGGAGDAVPDCQPCACEGGLKGRVRVRYEQGRARRGSAGCAVVFGSIDLPEAVGGATWGTFWDTDFFLGGVSGNEGLAIWGRHLQLLPALEVLEVLKAEARNFCLGEREEMGQGAIVMGRCAGEKLGACWSA